MIPPAPPARSDRFPKPPHRRAPDSSPNRCASGCASRSRSTSRCNDVVSSDSGRPSRSRSKCRSAAASSALRSLTFSTSSLRASATSPDMNTPKAIRKFSKMRAWNAAISAAPSAARRLVVGHRSIRLQYKTRIDWQSPVLLECMRITEELPWLLVSSWTCPRLDEKWRGFFET